MKLNVTERLLILGMQEIPRFGNIVTMQIVQNLFARVSFTEKEVEEWEIVFKEQDGKSNVRWNPSKALAAEIDITNGMAQVIFDAINKMPEAPLSIVPLYERIQDMVTIPVPEEVIK